MAADVDKQSAATGLAAENARLRAQVAALEGELAAQAARANDAVARAQERVYWLDVWHVDLNRVMRTTVGRRIPGIVSFARRVRRRLGRVRRRLLG